MLSNTSAANLRCRLVFVSILCVALSTTRASSQTTEKAEPPTAEEAISQFAYSVDLQPPAQNSAQHSAPWRDALVSPAVFDKARFDLHDLRLYTEPGREVAYALRVRTDTFEQSKLDHKEFNRTRGADRSSDVSLELTEQDVEHNQVSIDMPGDNYRRRVTLEGSDDGTAWKPLAEQYLIDFRRGQVVLRDQSLDYPRSRFRFLRLRVFPDPLVDQEPVKIGTLSVMRRVEIPGEDLVLPAVIGPREPVRGDGGPGSRWTLELGGDNTPVDSIQVSIQDQEFVRNYRVEAGGPLESDQPFRTIGSGVWRRRAGEPVQPMVATFDETRAARLRLVVTDNRNPPLNLQQVNFSAPARQVVFEPPEDTLVRMYFGNPKAEDPRYDFARNLPQKLEPPPDRAKLGPVVDNPVYEPEPLPLTERWPWLIYVVLSAACLVLAGISVSLSRTAISAHDQQTTLDATPMA